MSLTSSCILVVGSTGTGKSTLIGFCTGNPVETSSGTKECTLDIKAFKQKGNETGPIWVDSVGFDGTDRGRSDEEAFQYILRFLQEKQASYIAGVLWTINPDDREAAKIQEQAKLINKFKEGQVWRNVVIVAKKSRADVRREASGALAAAGRYCNSGDVKTIGYALLEKLADKEKEFWKKQSQEDRLEQGIMTEEEARMTIEQTLQTLPASFQVVFCSSQCVDCGVVSDPRLFPQACHMIKEHVHTQSIIPFHRQDCLPVHPAPNLSNRHPGTVAYRTHSSVGPSVVQKVFNIKRHREIPYMSCCQADPSQAGCQIYHPCCQQKQGALGCKIVFPCCGAEDTGENSGCARRYPCCGGEEGALGCRAQCSYCKELWGEYNQDCIGRQHNNVVKI